MEPGIVIDQIAQGIVIDHIAPGKAMEIYNYLNLGELECSVAIIKNAKSKRFGRKDIIKIENPLDIDFNVLSCIDPNVTVNIIKNGFAVKKSVSLPDRITNVVKCRNPRCITSIEQDIEHVFRLSDKAEGIYRCIYCEQSPVSGQMK